jgi:hypothetical protein
MIMLSQIPMTLLAAILSALPTAEPSPVPLPFEDSKAVQSATCAFSNVRYSGWCRVTQDVPEGSTPDEVCQKVLNCLNDTSCTKTYCNATDIRGGWKLEEVQTDK